MPRKKTENTGCESPPLQTVVIPAPNAQPPGLLDLPRVGGIKALRFGARDPQDLPGQPSASSVTDRAYKQNGRHTIEFIPQLRSFLVTFYGSKKERLLIHETVPMNVILPDEGESKPS